MTLSKVEIAAIVIGCVIGVLLVVLIAMKGSNMMIESGRRERLMFAKAVTSNQ